MNGVCACPRFCFAKLAVKSRLPRPTHSVLLYVFAVRQNAGVQRTGKFINHALTAPLRTPPPAKLYFPAGWNTVVSFKYRFHCPRPILTGYCPPVCRDALFLWYPASFPLLQICMAYTQSSCSYAHWASPAICTSPINKCPPLYSSRTVN